MISSIVFVNAKGEILIYRIFKNDVTRAEILNFCTRIVVRKENREVPIINLDGVSFIYITVKDMTVVATTKSNVNAIMTTQFLYSLVSLFKAYFGCEFDENQVRKNFALIYELLDEAMDYGVPQILEPELLKKSITGGRIKINLNDLNSLIKYRTSQTGPISWISGRDESVFYMKNEVYLDVIESVNVTLSSKGTLLRADVNGQVVVRCQLSGMPECKFGMNDKLLIEKCPRKTTSGDKGIAIDYLKFHQCVRLAKFEKERAIIFVPPDGIFELMSYRITENVNLPFEIMPVINEHGKNKIEVRIKLKALFEKRICATNVFLKVPCPKQTAIAIASAGIGKAQYEPEYGGIMWRIRKVQGETEALLRCEITLSESRDDKPWVKPPISLDFQVPMFTASGFIVRFLRVSEKSGYKPTKFIRYITKAGEYQHRI